MTYQFRRAIASEAKPLVGLYAESGCGKTYGALMIAKGFTGDMSKVGMIETESGRGEAWADDPTVGGYGVLPLRESFSPTAYGQAIKAAEQAGMQALIIDSASHEWEGVGGVLSMAADNEAAGKKGPLVWQKPKIEHAREFMLRLTQTPIPLVIVCMRARYAMEQVPNSKDWKRSTELTPKQSDDILSEMFVHGWIDRAHIFHGTKYTVESMRPVFKDGERLSVESGRRLAEWATARAKPATRLEQLAGPADSGALISPDQVIFLGDRCRDNQIDVGKLLAQSGAKSLASLPADQYKRASDWIDRVLEARSAKTGAST